MQRVRPGMLFGDRYLVLGVLGEGGMGVVVQAHDQRLGRDVAVKVLASRVVGDRVARGRLLREARAAAALQHPAIVQIHDVGELEDGGIYVVMELVRGQSLDRSLRSPDLPVDAKVRLVAEVARAVGAVHRAGLVHRDIKPGNVLLREDGRVALLDFGIAKSSLPEGDVGAGDTSLTSQGTILGTPGYLSPEQALGREADARSDQFALGVMAYEAIAGRLPWRGDTAMALLVSIARDEAAPPRAAGLDAAIGDAVLRALSKEPLARFPDVDAFADAIAPPGSADVVSTPVWASAPRIAVTPSGRDEIAVARTESDLALERTMDASAPAFRPPTTRDTRTSLRRRLSLLIAAALILVAGTSALLWWKTRGGDAATSLERRTLAVVGFKNLSGSAQAAWLSTAFMELLATELAGPTLRPLASETIARIRAELSLEHADSFAAPTLARLRANSGAHLVVVGSYLALDPAPSGRVRIDVRVQDTANGETIAVASATGAIGDLFAVVERAGVDLRRSLGAAPTPAEERTPALAGALPRSPVAARHYAEAIEQRRAFDMTAARVSIERALAVEPEHAMSHVLLADVLFGLGLELDARREAQIAFERSAHLPKIDRLAIEARYRRATREWDRAVECLRALLEVTEDVEHGLLLAATLDEAGRHEEMAAVAEQLTRLPAPARDDPRIAVSACHARSGRGDFHAAIDAARRAATAAEARGATLVGAEAKLCEGASYYNLGEYSEAHAALSVARDRFGGAGRRSMLGMVLVRLAAIFAHQGQQRKSLELVDEAIENFDRLGAKPSHATSVLNSVLPLIFTGQLDEARRRLHQLAPEKELPPPMVPGLHVRKGLLELLGAALDDARTDLEKAVHAAESRRDRRIAAWALSFLGELHVERGDLRGAREALERSLALREELKLRVFSAESRSALARLALVEGRYADAEALAAAAVDVFRAEEALDREALALALQASAADALGRRDDALRLVETALARAARVDNRDVSLRVAIHAARIRAQGGADAARASLEALEATRQEATSIRFTLHAMTATLEIGRAQLLAGDRLAARKTLGELARIAGQVGAKRIAMEAARLRQ